MKIEKTICPYCGANMNLLPGQERAECEYCGSSVIVSDVKGDSRKDGLSDNTRPTALKYKQSTTEPVRHSLFPPPGFRSGNILHMIIALCGYLFILAVALGLGSPMDSIFFIAASLSAIDICLDWTGLWSRLVGLHSDNLVLRIIAKIFWSIVAFLIWISMLVIIEMVLGI